MLVAVLVAAAMACSPLASGYYSFTAWGPLTLGAIVVLVVLVLVVRPRLSRLGLVAALGLLALLGLSFASILWAESRDSAWTSANQLALYVVIFGIGLLAIRTGRSARMVLLILGLPALVTSLVLAALLASGGGGDAYLLGRLDSPIGYVNASAGLLAMGIWPWLAIAEFTRSHRLRALALGGAALIAGIAITTQARALVPAFLVATTMVMIAAPGRTRRALHLAIVVLATAGGAHWTLDIYRSTGPVQAYMPPVGVLRAAGLGVIGGGLVAAALSLMLTGLTERIAPERRARMGRAAGRVLLALSTATVLAVGFSARNTIVTQWHDFTHLNPEQSAPDRFAAIGSGFRFDLWRIALGEFRSAPVIGVGAGNYDDAYYRLRQNPQSVTVPHSLEMQTLAELGVLGAIALILFCGGVLAAGVLGGRQRPGSPNPEIRVAALGLFTAWLAETSVDWLYNIPGLTGMAMLAAAILVVRTRDDAGTGWTATENVEVSDRGVSRRVGTADAHPPTRKLALVVVLGILALLTASLGRQYAATLYRLNGQRLVSRTPLQALYRLRTAEQLDPWSMQTQYAVASAYARLDNYSAARATLLHAERLEPDNYVPPALMGDIATRAGDERTALLSYQHALRLDPREPVLQQAVRDAKAALR